MTVVNKFNVNKQQVTLDADIIENMSANDVSYDSSTQYNENTVGDKLSKLSQQVIYDVTLNNNGATFASLSELLSSENLSTLIPVSVRCGEMSIRFVQSSDNKYVQYRYMSTATTGSDNPFLNAANWNGVYDDRDYINVRSGYFIDQEGNPHKYKTCFYSELLNIPKKTCVFKNIWNLSTNPNNYYSILYLDKDLNVVGHIISYNGIYTFDPSQETIPEGACWIVLNGQSENHYFIVERSSYDNIHTGIDFETQKRLVQKDIPEIRNDLSSNENLLGNENLKCISTSVFMKNAVYYINTLGVISHYINGYITTKGRIYYEPSGKYKVAIFKVFPGHSYRAYIYYEAPELVGNWITLNSNFDSLQDSPFLAESEPRGDWYNIEIPNNPEIEYIAMNICWNDNETLNFRKFQFLENTKINEENIIIESEQNYSKNNRSNVNLVNLPFDTKNLDFTKLSPRYLNIFNNTYLSECFFTFSEKFSQKAFAFKNLVSNTKVSAGFSTKIYASEIEKYLNWDENEHTVLNIDRYINWTRSDVVGENTQFFVEVFYSYDETFEQKVQHFATNSDRWDLTNRYDHIFYENGRIQDNSPAIVNNPDKDFVVYTANVGYNYPLYKHISDESDKQLTFMALRISITDNYFGTPPLTYNTNEAFIAVCPGENSIKSRKQVPCTIMDLNVTQYDLFKGGKYIDNSFIDFSEIGGNASSEVVSLKTSDKIAFYGCSFTESYYAIKNKSWVNKLSNLLDLPILNFGVSGNRIVELSQRLRANSNPYNSGIGIKELKPTYIVIQNIGNESLHIATDATLELYLQQIREMVENIKAIGAIPVLGTDFVIGNPSVDVQLKTIADELGIIYCPIGTICEKFCEQKYKGFWGGGHPASRTNESTTEEWYHQLKNLNVRQSVKIFRVRDEFAAGVSSISDLNYDSLYQRLHKYIEINCGEISLKESDDSWKYYDNLDNRQYSGQVNVNEYGVLMNNSTIEFTNYALIEFISPKVKCKSKITIPCSTSGLKFYMKNANNPVEPYPVDRTNAAFYVTKDVWNAFNASVGDKFTSNASGYEQISYAGKVRGQEYGGYVLLFESTETYSGGSGNLVNVSTSVQTAYLSCSYALGRYVYEFYKTLNKPVSNFEEVVATYVDGVYTIELNDYKYWEYDKMRIIVEKSGNFSLGAPTCVVIGGENKVTKVTKVSPKQSGDTELCEQTGFGVSDYNNIWNKEDGIIFEKIPDSIKDYPQFTTNDSHVVLTQKESGFSNKISKLFTIPTSRGYRKMYVRVSSRIFPKIYNQTADDEYHTTIRQITPTSNDYGRLELAVSVSGNSNPSAVCEALVGCGWAEKFFELTIPPFVTSVKLEIYRNPHDFDETDKLARDWPMEVCDISVSIHNM